MKNTLLSATVLASSALFVGQAAAIPLGSNITISDNNYVSDITSWYGNHEDQETEANPFTLQGQHWDLEGVFINSSTLSLVGGYDFKNGSTWAGHNYRSGDLFIDTDSNAIYGQAANGGSGVGGSTTNLFGWDYVLKLDFSDLSYDLIDLKSGPSVTLLKGLDVASSNPWRHASGGTAIGGGAFGYTSGLSDADVGFAGGSHYSLSFDRSFLNTLVGDGSATFHYTMECGNDNLMGRTNVPDLASTALLFGCSLAGLVALRRRLPAA